MDAHRCPGDARAHGAAVALLRWRVALVLAGLAVTLAVVNGNIWQREALLAKGRVAILELAPVDPRSLMQGDYMALRFAAGEDIERWRNDRPADGQDAAAFAHIDGYVVLAPDERGVARPVRIQEQAAPRDGNEIVLRYRLRASGVRLVTNAYFFPEGEQQRYQRARYGEMRVDDRGPACWCACWARISIRFRTGRHGGVAHAETLRPLCGGRLQECLGRGCRQGREAQAAPGLLQHAQRLAAIERRRAILLR